MDILASLVCGYRGTSLTNECMLELKNTLLQKRLHDFEICGNMFFKVSKMCCCDDECGGLFCDPVTVKSLCGMADRDMILDECLSGLHVCIVKCSEKQTKFTSERY